MWTAVSVLPYLSLAPPPVAEVQVAYVGDRREVSSHPPPPPKQPGGTDAVSSCYDIRVRFHRKSVLKVLGADFCDIYIYIYYTGRVSQYPLLERVQPG